MDEKESILNSVKKMLGITPENTQFDTDVIIAINTVFSILAQLGAGPDGGFSINDDTTTWDEYLNGDKLLNDVKTVMFLRVRNIFDPPLTSSVLESSNKIIAELEYRIITAIENMR